jgi:quercetin dioxygenase-like cupin family protein
MKEPRNDLPTGGTHGQPGVRTTSPLAADDPTRELAIARSDDDALVHLAVVGDTYTVLLSGEQTDGRFAMLDMLIPPGGGPPPHRHNFEECFRVLAGSIEVHLRDLPPVRLEAGDSANIPANAPHAFRNTADAPARLLCTVAPAGLERFFAEFGDPVPTRTSPAPELSDVERRNRLERAAAKAPEYGIEMLVQAALTGGLTRDSYGRRGTTKPRKWQMS